MNASRSRRSSGHTVDPQEQARFAALGNEWWAEDGELDALKAYNPVRLAFIREAVAEGLGHKPALKATEKTPLAGLKVLDIGCGGGILAEPLAKLGAQVTGIDATAEAIEAARAHAIKQKLNIDYHVTTTDSFKPAAKFDVVIASEVLEHVADADVFLAQGAALLRKGGVMVVTTFNRTLKSLAFGVWAAERLLQAAPKGTHDWKKFRKPSEVAAILAAQGLELQDVQGALYNPLTGTMRASRRHLDINYMLWAKKA